jgi:hypothetical protein
MSKNTSIITELNGKTVTINISEKDGALPEVSIKKTRVKQVEATYTVSEYYDIPDDVYLLDESDNTFNPKVYGSWYIKYSTLYYIDKELNIQEIESGDDVREQMCRPEKTSTDTESITRWLECGECGVESNDKTIDGYQTVCMCCHRDFCGKCADNIENEDDQRCDECINNCDDNKRCHNGVSDCDCSEESDDEDEESESDSDDE